MAEFSHDPATDAELSRIAEQRAAERTADHRPHPLEGAFEPAAQAFAENYPRVPADQIASVSAAISLKRIADALSTHNPEG